MCDYDSDESSIHLYDIPEFPGYDQPQANTEVRASTQRVELYSSGSPSSGRDLIGEASTRDYSPEEESTVDYSSGEDLTDEESPGEVSIVVNQPRQATSQHVTTVSTSRLVQRQELPQVLGSISETSSRLKRSEEKIRAEARRNEQQALLKKIIANPRRRIDRASAIHRLQEKAGTIKLGSREEDLRIFELAVLAQEVAAKTEKTAEELFQEYNRSAKRRKAKSIALKQKSAIRVSASDNLVQTPNFNLGNVGVPKEEVRPAIPITQSKRTIRVQANLRARKSLKKLRLAVSTGGRIPLSQIIALRERVKLAAQTSGKTPEAELAGLNHSQQKRAKSLNRGDSGDSISSQVLRSVPGKRAAKVTVARPRNHFPLQISVITINMYQKSHGTYKSKVYWQQRHSIFSRYDEGICMTDDAWFGVTPEPVANHVASDLGRITSSSKTILIDLFAGAGGNTIAFALSGRWEKIIAIERDASVLACAQHNAAIYDVFDNITWIHDDSFSYVPGNAVLDPSKTVIFASPPWGGPGYRTDEIFNLATMHPYSLKQIHDMCKMMDCALYLPRTSDLRQIAKVAPDGKKIEVVQYCMEGASKALVAYIPAARE